MENQQHTDWWDELSEEEKLEIDAGFAAADRGEVFSHEEVMEKYRKHGRSDIKN